jgi:hypothetical protein
VAVICFLVPAKWDIDTIIQPSKFFVQTEGGQLIEVLFQDPSQLVSEINEGAYDSIIADEMNIDIKKFPRIRARNLRGTQLVQAVLTGNDIEKATQILYSLFDHIKENIDKKTDVEIKDIDTNIEINQNLIKHKELLIKENLKKIRLRQIEKNKTRQAISTAIKKLEISKDRINNIEIEMKDVKKRIDDLEQQQKKALEEKKDSIDAISLLLYSNEVQQNLRYYNTLDEKLSDERLNQENLSLFIKEKTEEIKELDTMIETIEIEIDKIKNEIDNVQKEIGFLEERKSRIDYTKLIKTPTSSLNPVSPKKAFNLLIAGILSLLFFTTLALLVEYLKKQRSHDQS